MQVFSSRRSHRAGVTIPELLIVLTIIGVVLSIAVPRASLTLDRISVRAAAGDVAAALSAARTVALEGRSIVAIDVDSSTGTLRVRRGGEVLFTRPVGEAHGVKVGGNRDSLAYGPLGLGRGAANLSIVIRKRSAVETVFVSRLGRVR